MAHVKLNARQFAALTGNRPRSPATRSPRSSTASGLRNPSTLASSARSAKRSCRREPLDKLLGSLADAIHSAGARGR